MLDLATPIRKCNYTAHESKNMNTCLAILLALRCATGFCPQQDDIWQHVIVNPRLVQLRSITPSPNQLSIIRKALAARARVDRWSCAEGDEPDWVEKVTFDDLPISPTEPAILVEAGMGCARGGQGANGAMWVVQFKGNKLTFLATPEQKFSGWLYSIQPTTSHGFRDLVLGWHMRAGESNLFYFRFDGKSYRLFGSAQLLSDEHGAEKIVPTPAS